MAKAMHLRLNDVAAEEDKEFEWDPKTMSIKCFAHKLALIVNAGLNMLGIVAPTPRMIRKATLGSFPVSDILADAVDHPVDILEEPLATNDAINNAQYPATALPDDLDEPSGTRPPGNNSAPNPNRVPFTAPLPTD